MQVRRVVNGQVVPPFAEGATLSAWNSLGRLAGRCGVTAFRFLSLSLLLSPRSGSIVDPRTACNINYCKFASRARKSRTRSVRVDTLYVSLVSHARAATASEIPHLRKCSYKEGVGTAQNQMPLHVVGRSLTHELLLLCIQQFSRDYKH